MLFTRIMGYYVGQTSLIQFVGGHYIHHHWSTVIFSYKIIRWGVIICIDRRHYGQTSLLDDYSQMSRLGEDVRTLYSFRWECSNTNKLLAAILHKRRRSIKESSASLYFRNYIHINTYIITTSLLHTVSYLEYL